MATFTKFNPFVLALAEGKHNLTTATLKVMLTNTAPAAANAVKTDITEIAAGNGYTAGGNTCTAVSSSQTAGVYKLVRNDPADWAASGSSMATFRWAVLYNDSATNDDLIGYWDNGSTITLTVGGDPFRVDFSSATGVLTLT